MVFNPFGIINKKFIGIDIGTSFIKIVEISRAGDRRKLENYGEISAQTLYKKPFRTFEKSTLSLSSQEVAKAISAILNEAKIKTKKACFSIPDFSTFYTSFNLPPMTKEEVAEAVRFEARQHVPMPLSEVTLDWQVIEERNIKKDEILRKILLVAVPNEIVYQYQSIVRLAGLESVALEAEVFALVRSLIKEKETLCLIDIGAQSTTISIVRKGILLLSHSFDVSGNEFTQRVAASMGVTEREAEKIKKEKGLDDEGKIGEILKPLIDLILDEIEKISQNFYRREGNKIEKFVLAGGSALLPGLKDYFSKKFPGEIKIANPFEDLFYPAILKEKLWEMGPSYAIAVGLALRGLE